MVKNHVTPTRFAKECTVQPRTAHEMRRAAQVLELSVAAYGEDFVDSEPGECLVRNIIGLAKADEFQKPSLMNEFEWMPPLQVIPPDMLRLLLKDNLRNDRFRASNKAKKKPTKDPKDPDSSS
jgi:hypothetical protein